MGYERRSASRRRREEEGDGDWMTSYSDVVSLLFAFMAIILSVSKVDVSKMDRLSSSISGTLTGEHQETNLEQVRNKLESALAASGFEAGAKVRTSERGIEVDLASGILFQPGSADLSLEAERLLASVGDGISALPVTIEVEGHTDSVPIRSARFPSNWELSGARASEVVRWMIRAGIDPGRMKAVGLADTRPPFTQGEIGESTEDAMARQRRVTLILVPQTSELLMAGRDKRRQGEGSRF